MNVLVPVDSTSSYDEPLRVARGVCKRLDCGCDCAWFTFDTGQRSQLARVAERPVASSRRDAHVDHMLAIADKHPIGTILRCQFDWKVDPGKVSVEAFLEHWTITVVEEGQTR